MKTIAIGVLLAIIASISITTTKALFAQRPRATRPKYTRDANNDGFLDRIFSGDANNDGFLDRSLSSGSIDRSWRELADTNYDGKVSLNEFSVYREEHDRDQALGVFKVIDTNRDNFIDKDEMSAWFRWSQGVQSNHKWQITTTINGKTTVMTSDGEGDTKLNLAEFRSYYASTQGVDQAIQEVDDAIENIGDIFDSFTRPKYIGDGNNDGFLDRTEVPRPRDSFTRPKYVGYGNNDGFLDRTEVPRPNFGDFVDSFTRPQYTRDGNNDGFLDRTEVPRPNFGDMVSYFFGNGDGNNDGITRTEAPRPNFSDFVNSFFGR